MNLNEYVKKVENTTIDYDGVYGHQCVDLIKNYTKNVLDYRLWSFWGSAASWWVNYMNTFPSKDFERVVNDFSNPDQVPAVGDIIFIKTPYIYDHVAIVLDAPVGENYIRVLEQNVGNGDGRGYDDRVKIGTYTYSNVLGWYHFRKKQQKIRDTISLEWAKKAMEKWIWNGRNPKKPATREEVATMVYNALILK